MATYRELVERARRAIEEMTPTEVLGKLGEITLVDIREPEEHEQGTIPGALLLPRGLLERDIAVLIGKDAHLVLYCESGSRSALAALTLDEMGYRASSMAGGFEEWKRAGHPWAGPAGLSIDQRARYARHLRLPEVGEVGQVRLLGARVLVIGVGGLGSPAALYLAAAGVGTIGIVDDDLVDQSNLQRQVIHTIDRVGTPKVDSAREAILGLNPDIKVDTHRLRLNAGNALAVMSGYDVVVDGGDNFPTRYLVNDASLHLGMPVVHGSIFRFEGQATVFRPYDGPCYRCLHGLPPAPGSAASCVEAGVLGVLPGVIGSIQATEAIKLILGIGQGLVGRLLVYDSLDQEFTLLPVSRDPRCPACSDRTRPPTLVDYNETCHPIA